MNTLLDAHRRSFVLAAGALLSMVFLGMAACHAGQATYPLGDIGGRAATIDGQPRQLKIAAIQPGGPAGNAGLVVGDVIEGVDGEPFMEGSMMPLRQLGTALDLAQGRDGRLPLAVLRGGKSVVVTLRLPLAGQFSPTYPFDCQKSDRIYQAACAAIAVALQRGSLPGGDLTTALAVMGLMGDRSGRGLEVARPTVLRLAGNYAAGPKERSVWVLSYVGVMLCEYQIVSPDPVVAAAIGRIAEVLVAGVPQHGRYGHHINADPEDLPYDGQGLNGTTTAALWFFASAARAGLEPSALEPAFSRAFERIRSETNAGGGVGYAWPADHQSSMRSGQTALACSHIVQTPAWMATNANQLNRYATAVASWPTRHADDLLEAHAVSSLGMTASTAGLAAFDRKAHHALMQQWRWYFALSWQPAPGGSDHELAYVGGPNNTGGDFYLNGHRDLEHDGFNSIMNATVVFIFAAAQERLSFYGGMPAVPGLSTAVLLRSPALKQATAALHQKKYAAAHRLASTATDRASTPSGTSASAAGVDENDPGRVAAAFVEYIELQHLTPALEHIRSLREAGDVAAALDSIKPFVAEVRGLEAYETPARKLLDELNAQEMKDAIAAGRLFRKLEARARLGSKAAVGDLAAFAAQHESNFYGQAAARLLSAIESGRPLEEATVAAASSPEPLAADALPISDLNEFSDPDRPLTLDEALGK